MPKWVKEWAPVAVIIATIAGSHVLLRSDMNRMEDQLTNAIETNQQAITALGREVSELRGELKGRDLILGEEDR
ncbi:MAG: hypothetical protein F4151_01175 [Gammaproteobacteria bacterium]|nr:hypothetical protein [Gammaproteobacteria bacterium]